MEFKEYYLGELCEIKSSKRIYAKDYVNKGIPFYRSKEIIEKSKGLDISQNLYIDNKKFEEIEEKHGIPETGDLLLTSVGTLGVPYIVKNEKFYFKDGNLTWFTNFKSLLNQYYLFYWFKSKEGKGEINRVTIGSTQKALTIKNLRYLKITLPDKKNQFKIINLIQKIENKLENNKQVIANLEELSQTLFKRWFVDFEFPDENGNPYKSSGGEMVDSELGKIPKGWEIVNLNDISLKISKGTTPKKDINTESSSQNIPFLKVKDLSDFYDIKMENVQYISKNTHENLLKRSKLQPQDILLSIAGTIGRIAYVPTTLKNVNINQAIGFIRLKNNNYFLYIYNYLKQNDFQNYLTKSVVQAVQANISLKVIKEYKVLIPVNNLINDWDSHIQSLHDKIGIKKNEINQLTQLRDTLLPKLMSGEIEIPDDIEVNEDELSI
ncbi:restriction endonuclease subunit S [Mammaliicoccus vitulinus]|uniref:Restriction endonuclease subunit S n=1 Tax=Mammaliicoccus vitulinus TaxID=71237 RepID=A0A2T4PX77_9STAP|nr:restriction endonuclease subunit S [Mammaliicoccus vitulinus]PTI31136.1 restriction endonuclease subunit S [Mammaliicoccus vitulinus]